VKSTTFGKFSWKVISLHMITYVITGMIFSTLFNYKQLYQTGTLAYYMKDFSSPWISAGPALQLIRGFLFAFILWPFYDFIFSKQNGWAFLWLLLFGFAIIGTAAAAPGSLEGIIYTRLSLTEHLFGLPEVMLQTFLFSVLLFRWMKYRRKYFNTISIMAVLLIILMSILGVLSTRGYIRF
jgi:hypothetical protein